MIETLISGKKVLFISTKNKDYIRNTQEINMIQENAVYSQVIAYSDKSYLKRVLKVWFRTFCCLFSLKKYDIIFVGFAPQLIFFLFPFFKRKKIVIDFFISMYDTLVDDRKKIPAHSILAKWVHHIDRYVLMKAEVIIVDTYADKDYFFKEFDLPELKNMEVLYLKPDISIYNPALYPARGKDNFFYVLYFGSILPLQGVDIILEAIEMMEVYDRIKFIIIGPVHTAPDKSGYKNAVFYQWLKQEELAEQISKADLCLAGHFNGHIGKAKRTIAGKTYIYKAMGKPVILGECPANRELFYEDGKTNFYVEMGNAIALKEKILEVKEIIAHENG